MAAALLTACSTGHPSPQVTVVVSPNLHGPYYVTAIDYHFHDAHPTVPLSPGRKLVFANESDNIHNVTIPGTSFSRDFKPGHLISIDPVGSLLSKPGRYPFFCTFHVDRGMKGVIVVR